MFISGDYMSGENWEVLLPQKKKRKGKQLAVYPASSPSPDPHLMTQASEAQREKGPGAMAWTSNSAGTKAHTP